MTCREMLAKSMPWKVDDTRDGGCFGCPSNYGYLSDPCWCNEDNETCTKCWDREVPESEPSKSICQYETVKIVRCRNCTYSVPGKDDSHVICMAEKAYRDSDFFCKNGEPKKN